MFLLCSCITIFYSTSFVESKLYLPSHILPKNNSVWQESSFSETFKFSVAIDQRPNHNYDSTRKKFKYREVCQATFIRDYNYISILTINNEFLDSIQVNDWIGQVEWHTDTTTFIASKAVILVVELVEDLNQLIHTQTFWTQDAIFVITVLQCTPGVKLEMASLWQVFSIYKYVLVCDVSDHVLYIYRPYYTRREIAEVSDLSEIRYNILHGTNNLHGAIIRVVFFPRVPSAIIRNGLFVGGPDYLALQTLKERMNFTSVILHPTDGKTFTEAGEKVTGSAKDIVDGNGDIALNAHFVQDYKIPGMLLTKFVYMDKICFVVGLPTLKSHSTVIIHIFSLGVWIHIVLIYYIIILLYFAIQKINRSQIHDIQELLFQTFSLIVLGASNLRVDSISKKILIGSALITALILNNTFQGSLVTVLSRPIRNRFIDSLEDILQSDLALQSQRAESLISDPEMIPLLNTLRKRKLNKRGTNFIRVGRFPIMKLVAYKNYLYFKDNSTELLHTVPECIMSNFLAYVIPQNSPLLDKINTYLQRFQEAGLISKWFSGEMDYLLRNTYKPLEKEYFIPTQAKVFTLADLVFVFSLLISGIVFSTVVFIVEKTLSFYVLH